MITYNKLVRDRIPEIITAAGKTAITEVISNDQEYMAFIINKVIEEAQELQQSMFGGDSSHILLELADLLEIIDALVAVSGFNESSIKKIKTTRRRERGGFEKRIKLIAVEG